MLILLRVEYLHKLLGILLQRRFVPPPPTLVYLFIQSFIYI